MYLVIIRTKVKKPLSPLHAFILTIEGEWIKVDEVGVGKEFFRGNYEWFDTSNFWLNGGTTGSLLVRLIIKIEGILLLETNSNCFFVLRYSTK